MKKILSILLATMLICSFSACEQNEQPIPTQQQEESAHVCTFGDWEIDKRPTCTEQGTEKRECSVCKTAEYRSIPITEHNWKKWYVSKKATCTEQGTETRECDSCGYTQSVPILALNHNYGEPSFLWKNISDDSNIVTASATCQNDKSHIHSVSCEINKSFSLSDDETVIYLVETATTELNGITYTSTRYKSILKWRTFYLTNSNYSDWLYLGFSYTAPKTVAFQVKALYDDVVYNNVSVTFTTDTFGRIYYTSGAYTTAYAEHQYDDWTLSVGEYKEETLTTSLSVQTCSIKSIFVDGSVSYWAETSGDWIYS